MNGRGGGSADDESVAERRPFAGPDDGGGQMDAEAFLRLSEGLRVAFAEVTGARLSADEGARWQRRLIAVTTVAKRDLENALQMLERFQRDWSARRR